MAVTAPFLILSLTGWMKNESSMVLLYPFMAGLPWGFAYLALPFDIPGFTSPGVPDAEGNLQTSVGMVILAFLPVYLNIYLLMRFVIYRRK